MALGVFIHRPDSIYDDRPAERYQFPRQYLGRVQACLGDWILYYEPRKLPGTRGYFAVARVQEVIPDPSAPRMFVAIIEPGSYLDFARPVPFADANGVLERGVLNVGGRVSGRAQAAVRPISPIDFDRILALGLDEHNVLLPRLGQNDAVSGFTEEQTLFAFEQERERLALIASRVVRDRVFRRVVLRAYDERCALTGLKLINGGGRAEVAAAHPSSRGKRSRHRQQRHCSIRYRALDVRPRLDRIIRRSRDHGLTTGKRSRWDPQLRQQDGTSVRA